MRYLTNGGVDKCNPTHNPSLGAIHRISLSSNKVLLILNPDILWNFAGMSGRITFSYRKSVVEPALPEIKLGEEGAPLVWELGHLPPDALGCLLLVCGHGRAPGGALCLAGHCNGYSQDWGLVWSLTQPGCYYWALSGLMDVKQQNQVRGHIHSCTTVRWYVT